MKKLFNKVLEKTINFLIHLDDKLNPCKPDVTFHARFGSSNMVKMQPSDKIGRFNYRERVFIVDPLGSRDTEGPFAVVSHIPDEDDSYQLSNGTWVAGICLIPESEYLARTTN